MKKTFTISLLSLLFLAFTTSDEQDKRIYKSTEDDNSKFTNVGNIAVTVTNIGTYGHRFSLWPEQPGCEFPIGSGIEHLYEGGLWVGGFISNDAEGSGSAGPFVTTATMDATLIGQLGGGAEFTNEKGSFVKERSSLIDSKFFNPHAVSHQDLVMDYADTSYVLLNGEPITGHTPLGIAVRQETYAWNFPFADFFIIMNYWIKNTSNKYIDNIYTGMWTDNVIRNTIVTPYGTGGFFTRGGNGFNDSLYIAYEFDADGDIGFTNSYMGIQYLGADRRAREVNFTSWQYGNTTNPNYFAPRNDIQRYQKMLGFFGGENRWNDGINPDDLKQPSNRSTLISSGPYRSLAPGDSMNVTFAFVCAKKFGSNLASEDSDLQKTNLYNNASWAIRAYNGEDKNGNGELDEGEDLDSDGEITRYILPAPPQSPSVRVVPESNKVSIYWDDRAENSVDPISGKKDFEGYRIYRTNLGFDLTVSLDVAGSYIKMAEFDSTGNGFGYDTGFDHVLLTEPVTFPDDEKQYTYKFEIDNLLNGWQYAFSVTAFDEGDKENNLESLESSLLGSTQRVLPGTTPTSEESDEVGVYPNPYYGEAIWDGPSERLRKIYFYNLPEECEIVIYTLSGDIVKTLYHDQESNGSDNRWFETFSKDGSQRMSGGEHPWDLITDADQAIATGLYLFSVLDSNTGNVKHGKFLVIK
jgi:hypothetical protein